MAIMFAYHAPSIALTYFSNPRYSQDQCSRFGASCYFMKRSQNGCLGIVHQPQSLGQMDFPLNFTVDFEKAFDSVKWDYLDETLKAFGFGLKWRNWISSCLNNAMGSVLVNSSPTLEFQFHKGLKQGEVALKVLYKRLYALEMCKSISVAEKMGHPSLSHSFCRMPRGGVEQENYGLLCSKVADLVLPNISDRWCWSLEGSQEFSVKSSRILIDNTILSKAEGSIPRWLRVVPIKVNVHAWRIAG
ncbi:RNA-directed DNA polymerase, eukaryota, reverse transcriptase zinc-binding domain protein [Tanacetum coccineum]